MSFNNLRNNLILCGELLLNGIVHLYGYVHFFSRYCLVVRFFGATFSRRFSPDIPVLFIICKHSWAFRTISPAPEGPASAPGDAETLLVIGIFVHLLLDDCITRYFTQGAAATLIFIDFTFLKYII